MVKMEHNLRKKMKFRGLYFLSSSEFSVFIQEGRSVVLGSGRLLPGGGVGKSGRGG